MKSTSPQKEYIRLAAACMRRTAEQLADECSLNVINIAVEDHLNYKPDWRPSPIVSHKAMKAARPVTDSKIKANRIMQTPEAGA